jgi:hypothetical protein
MNDENTRRIIAACPSLYDSMEEERDKIGIQPFHPIAFGFECGDGWADLLVELSEKIQARLNEMPKDVASEYVALQVKEKFGTLRFYTSYCDDVIDGFIREAEQKSACTCEQCGAPGKIRGSVWYYTACDKHTREEDLNPLPESEMP